MGELKYKPTGYSYCVDMNVWAGEYPVWEWEQGARMRQLKLFTDFGINYFLDLTENGEMPPYAPFLVNSIGRHTFPIPNGCVPNSVRWVVDLFRIINGVLNKPGTKLYIHCVGGVLVARELLWRVITSTLWVCLRTTLLPKCVGGLPRTVAPPGCLRPKPKHR